MITYMPTIYPDELVYSWFGRYYVHSGCFSHKMALQELYCKKSDYNVIKLVAIFLWLDSIAGV